MVMRALAALAMALLLAAPAHADITPQARAKAKAHIKKARTLYDQEQYDGAVAEYEAAYALVGVADILFNVGQILRTKGDKPGAVKSYRRYLEAEPSGAHAQEAKDYSLELTRDQVPATSRARWDFVEHAQRTPSQEERWQKLIARVGAGDTSTVDGELDALENELNPKHPVVLDDATTRRAAAATLTTSPPPREPHHWPPYTKKWWFWTAIGGGAVIIVAVVVGAVLGQPGDPVPSLGVLK
jgi:tetratricopeptide (TPR) repeat protein